MKNVIEYLEQSAVQFPDKAAFVDERVSLSYGELRTKARVLASELLRRLDGGINRPIAVLMEKSALELLAFMGVTYSANFYTPLDASSPVLRLQKVVDTLSPALVITNAKNLDKAKALGFPEERVLLMERLSQAGGEDSAAIERALGQKIDTDPVYTLFTSGSTGVPKGVTICHRSVIDYIEWVCKTFRITGRDTFGNQAPFYFDNSVLDIYSTLKTGATLYLIPEKHFMFPLKLIEFLNEHQISAIFWVPSVLINLANTDAFSKKPCETLEKILFAGEVMPNLQLNYWRRHLPNALYANLYGPTEITVDCIYYVVDRDFSDDEPLPIGIPCDNTDILLLTEDNRRVSLPNQIGEICVRGSSLALGYWNNPQKTAEVFVQNPLNPYYPELIYKTGDLGYYNDRREIIFAGRKDSQIKHMGYRIELGEIETAVSGVDGVFECACLYEADKDRIVLFCHSEGLTAREVLEGVRDKLPKYMLPNRIHFLEQMPHNANGKIDRQLLKTMIREERQP